MKPSNVLILPGWQDSGPGHWQSLWVASHGYTKVEQHDWMRPLRGDWIARLEEVVLGCDEPAVLVAHSLGCQLVAAWAAHSRHTARVKAALLVAPGDVTQPALQAPLYSWARVALQALPFPSVLLGSQNDPYCSLAQARHYAQAWGARFIDYGLAGHINADTGLGDWPEGMAILQSLMD